MSPWTLTGLAALLLILPLALRPQAPPDRVEFRGLLSCLWYVNIAYCAIVHRLTTEAAPLPATGPAILISNHTCNIDNFLLQAATRRKLSFLIARMYYDAPLFRPFCERLGCIPVDPGRFTSASRAAIKALGEGRIVAVFPEGQILPTSGREIGEGKPGVAFIALKAKVPVIPAYIRGTPESNKVWVSFFTPSEARVVYGPPIPPPEPEGRGGHHERDQLAAMTESYMAAIRALRERDPGREPG